MSKTTDVKLIDIQKLQFSDRAAAESLMLQFLQLNEDPSIVSVELNPKPESLNSINGFVTYESAERYFFKTHVEEDEQISEYYNAEALASVGYPVVSARQITHRVGKQIALYEIVSYPTLFDLSKAAEDDENRSIGNGQLELHQQTQDLIRLQKQLDQLVQHIYADTLAQNDTSVQVKAPIHQLFSHRLAADGRVGLFYEGKHIPLDDGSKLTFDELSQLRWTINGVKYSDNLTEIIDRSRRLLAPAQGPSIVGHGDAHNGNVFYDSHADRLLLFDPAFAGRHDPLLDVTKPLFHNVFARWMYHPEDVCTEFELQYKVDRSKGEIRVEHTFQPSELRRQYLYSKITNVLEPLLELLSRRQMLRSDWVEFLRSSLFCCPFLTVNLFAPLVPNGSLAERYPATIKWLGLAMSVEFGSKSRQGQNAIANLIDQIFKTQGRYR